MNRRPDQEEKSRLSWLMLPGGTCGVTMLGVGGRGRLTGPIVVLNYLPISRLVISVARLPVDDGPVGTVSWVITLGEPHHRTLVVQRPLG